MPFELDVFQLANLIGLNLPSRGVVYLLLAIIFLLPFLAIWQAFTLYRRGGSQLVFILSLLYALVVIGIFLYVTFKVKSFMDKYHLRPTESESNRFHSARE